MASVSALHLSIFDKKAIVGWFVGTPSRAIGALVAVHFLALALIPFQFASAPELDVIEGLVWGREWLLGTHKLPPLPSWLIELSYLATGSPLLGPLLLSQISLALTYACIYAIGRRLTSPNNALAGTLLSSGIIYLNWTSTEFNHNVVQMPIWSAAFLLITLIRENPGDWRVWLFLGAVLGLGFYAKYSVVILCAVTFVWMIFGSRFAGFRMPWPWIGAALGLVIMAPHLIWLIRNDFLPLGYIRERTAGDGSLLPITKWILSQIGFQLPMGFLILAIGPRRLANLPFSERNESAVRFVAFLALSPAIIVILISLVSGSRPQNMWGMPMFSLSGLLLILLLRRAWSDQMLRHLWLSATATIALVGAAFSASIVVSRALDKPVQAAWPMYEIASKARSAWMSATDQKLEIVSGEMWLAGLVAIGAPERPHVVYDGFLSESPWLTPEVLARKGVLYLWKGQQVPQNLIPSNVEIAASGSFTVERLATEDRIISYAIRLPLRN